MAVERPAVKLDPLTEKYVERLIAETGLKRATVCSLLLTLIFCKCTGEKAESFLTGRRLENYNAIKRKCYGVVQGELF